jgi:hypothetical protein
MGRFDALFDHAIAQVDDREARHRAGFLFSAGLPVRLHLGVSRVAAKSLVLVFDGAAEGTQQEGWMYPCLFRELSRGQCDNASAALYAGAVIVGQEGLDDYPNLIVPPVVGRAVRDVLDLLCLVTDGFKFGF